MVNRNDVSLFGYSGEDRSGMGVSATNVEHEIDFTGFPVGVRSDNADEHQSPTEDNSILLLLNVNPIIDAYLQRPR